MRPSSVVNFERLCIASLLIEIINVSYKILQDKIGTNSGEIWVGPLLVLPFGLLLILRISRYKGKIALLIFFLACFAGIPSFIKGVSRWINEDKDIFTVLAGILQYCAASILLTPSARAWLWSPTYVQSTDRDGVITIDKKKMFISHVIERNTLSGKVTFYAIAAIFVIGYYAYTGRKGVSDHKDAAEQTAQPPPGNRTDATGLSMPVSADGWTFADEKAADGSVTHYIADPVVGRKFTVVIACQTSGVNPADGFGMMLVPGIDGESIKEASLRRIGQNATKPASIGENSVASFGKLMTMEGIDATDLVSFFGKAGPEIAAKWTQSHASNEEMGQDVVRIVKTYYDILLGTSDMIIYIKYIDRTGDKEDTATVKFDGIQAARDKIFKACMLRSPY